MILTDLQIEILKRKGYDLADENQKENIEKYLIPNWDRDLLDAGNIKDIDKSVDRIKKAIDINEKIVIYADYDCDGIPGAVVLHDFFQKINYKNFSIYIPHRHNEGYGLNKNAIKRFIEDGVSLIITIDVGITNLEEIQFAQDNNIDVIVTDHHLPILNENGKQILPMAFSVVNTKQEDDKYQEKYLCGASTVWKFVNHFLNKYRDEYSVPVGWEKWLLDMVGIATIADLVPLKNENRLFAKYGLEVLKKSKRPGLQKILKNAKIDQRKINEDDIAFAIAPRINSASRMAEPIHAFYALLQNEESISYAEELERYNNARKQDTKDAHSGIDYEKLKDQKIIFIGDEKWTPGIIGLLASRVVEKLNKTTFVWGVGEDENILKGSVRAGSDGYNVVHIMTEAKNILENFGGHEAAGGFAIHKNNLEKFKKFLKDYSEKNNFENIKIQTEENILDEEEDEKCIHVDLEKINRKIFDEIKIFAPFGIDNEKILFKINLKENSLLKNKRFGKQNEHLEVIIDGVRGIEFFVDNDREEELKNKKEFLVNLELDNFRGDVVMRFVK